METPATDKVRLVIQFLKTKDVLPVEIHRQFVEVCGEGKMNEGCVRKWYWLCKEGTTTRNRVPHPPPPSYARFTRTVQVENFRASSLQSRPCAK
jgi:hypothetical protein